MSRANLDADIDEARNRPDLFPAPLYLLCVEYRNPGDTVNVMTFSTKEAAVSYAEYFLDIGRFDWRTEPAATNEWWVEDEDEIVSIIRHFPMTYDEVLNIIHEAKEGKE